MEDDGPLVLAILRLPYWLASWLDFLVAIAVAAFTHLYLGLTQGIVASPSAS